VNRLLDLNHQFYQTFALQFSATRQRIQPGVKRLMATLSPTARILDIGCGNGELAHYLARNGHQGAYVGLDSSPGLLSIAQDRPPESLPTTFTLADLATPDWDDKVRDISPPSGQTAMPTAQFTVVFSFAVLHHLPSSHLRAQVLRKVRALLSPRGHFMHSEWQFLNSPRLRARIQPWENAGLSEQDVEPGDYLLDWRHGGFGLRYVHHFTESELLALAAETGFTVIDTFLSDGQADKLGLYQVWEPA